MGTDDMREFVLALVDTVQRARRQHSSVDSVERGAVGMLAQLAESGEVRGTELAQHACLDASTVSRHLRALDTAGCITRRTDPADARAALIDISPAGREVLAKALADRVTTFTRATAAWSPADRATLARLMRRLSNELENL